MCQAAPRVLLGVHMQCLFFARFCLRRKGKKRKKNVTLRHARREQRGERRKVCEDATRFALTLSCDGEPRLSSRFSLFMREKDKSRSRGLHDDILPLLGHLKVPSAPVLPTRHAFFSSLLLSTNTPLCSQATKKLGSASVRSGSSSFLSFFFFRNILNGCYKSSTVNYHNTFRVSSPQWHSSSSGITTTSTEQTQTHKEKECSPVKLFKTVAEICHHQPLFFFFLLA